ncbi:MLP protein [Trifolium repens]|nr:MLP protein [Trifolium repens]
MTINVSCALAKVVHPAIWRINIFIDFLKFNSPINRTMGTLVNYFKDELKLLIVSINIISTKELVNNFFLLIVNFFNSL